jgi:transposase-like protein
MMTKADIARRLAWRFKVIQQAGERSRNIARTCRHFGISRQAFYRWKRRVEADGALGLADRASAPHHSPTRRRGEVVSKILYLRQTYHFGPGKIADYLKRFHQQSLAVSSVHQILVRHGLNRLPRNQKHRTHAKRWQRYEKPQPGLRLQVDLKFLERIPGTQKRFYQFTAIDDCTRLLNDLSGLFFALAARILLRRLRVRRLYRDFLEPDHPCRRYPLYYRSHLGAPALDRHHRHHVDSAD